ncbi:MAG: hypothetical protein WDO71_26330 [Bacteroidota bacterium]
MQKLLTIFSLLFLTKVQAQTGKRQFNQQVCTCYSWRWGTILESQMIGKKENVYNEALNQPFTSN